MSNQGDEGKGQRGPPTPPLQSEIGRYLLTAEATLFLDFNSLCG